MKKRIFLAIGIVFIIGCQNTQPLQERSQEITVKHCDLNPFKSITVDGNTKVELINGAYGIDITGVQKYDCPNKTTNQELSINSTANLTSNASIRISAPELKNITVLGSATVSAQDFKAGNLTITAKDHGTINLEGQFNITKIFQFGRGRINIDWISSGSLLIEGYDHGPIYLAGKVNNLVVKLAKDATLYARYLHTEKAQVFTTDNALAEIMVYNTLDAFAIDKSSIYYYKNPKDITIVTRDGGNVLHPYWH